MTGWPAGPPARPQAASRHYRTCADVIRLAEAPGAEVTQEELFAGSLSGHEGLAAGAAGGT